MDVFIRHIKGLCPVNSTMSIRVYILYSMELSHSIGTVGAPPEYYTTKIENDFITFLHIPQVQTVGHTYRLMMYTFMHKLEEISVEATTVVHAPQQLIKKRCSNPINSCFSTYANYDIHTLGTYA